MTLGKHHFQALVQKAVRMAVKLSCGVDAEQLDLLPQNQCARSDFWINFRGDLDHWPMTKGRCQRSLVNSSTQSPLPRLRHWESASGPASLPEGMDWKLSSRL